MTSPLDPESLVYGLSTAVDPQVSPDGSWIVYGLNSYEQPGKTPRNRICLCRADGSVVRELTKPAQRAGGGRWAPDSTRIAYTATGDDGSSVWVLETENAAAPVRVTQHDGDVGELAWSPDGTLIACTLLVRHGREPTPSRVTRRLDYQEDGRGYLGETRKQVFLIAVADGSLRQLTSTSCDHHAPSWSPDGTTIAVASPAEPDERSELVLVDAASGKRRALSRSKAVQHWSWSPDGSRIVWAADPDQSLQPDYYLHDVVSGATGQLTDDPNFVPTSPAVPPVWLDGQRALVEASRRGASELVVLDTETGGVEVLERAETRYGGLTVDRSRRIVVQTESSPTSVGEISVYDLGSGRRRTITSHNTALLTAQPPAGWERFQVESDGWPIDAWLLKPPDFDPNKRYPLILDVHGGPTAHYGSGFMALQQCLATHGFLVVFANPRGSASYGRSFAQQNIRDWGGGDYRDLIAVVDAVLQREYADPARTGIFGYSYGGYMTSWTITQTDRFAAAVCGAPLFDLESYWGTSDIGHRGIERYAGGPPHTERTWYDQHSPSAFAHRAATPTLIIQGEEDHRCPVGQGEQMFVALRSAGCEAEFARYPGCSHLFLFTGPAAAREDFLARILKWFMVRLSPSS